MTREKELKILISHLSLITIWEVGVLLKNYERLKLHSLRPTICKIQRSFNGDGKLI